MIAGDYSEENIPYSSPIGVDTDTTGKKGQCSDIPSVFISFLLAIQAVKTW
jgi:hypothetical protein